MHAPKSAASSEATATVRRALCAALPPGAFNRLALRAEDLYAGIEHRQTQDVYQCLKLISVPGCERIVRYAFEYARANKRKRVTCVVKDNIMKLSDG